jgi:S-adenosylmethionine decarboxylase
MIGKHCIAELYDCRTDKLDDIDFIEKTVIEAIEKAGATLLDISKYKFQPQGITLVALLSESHLSFHSWPEMNPNIVALDIFTCGDAVPMKAVEHLVEKLKPSKHEIKSFNREYNP